MENIKSMMDVLAHTSTDMREYGDTPNISPLIQRNVRAWADVIMTLRHNLGKIQEYNCHNEQTQAEYETAIIESKTLRDENDKLTSTIEILECQVKDRERTIESQLLEIAILEQKLKLERRIFNSMMNTVRSE